MGVNRNARVGMWTRRAVGVAAAIALVLPLAAGCSSGSRGSGSASSGGTISGPIGGGPGTNGNTIPAITSSAPVTAQVGQPYQYNVAANDADGDPLGYTLAVSPAGMVIDAQTGAITWTPAAGQEGQHPVTVVVNDGTDSINQDFVVVVTAATSSGGGGTGGGGTGTGGGGTGGGGGATNPNASGGSGGGSQGQVVSHNFTSGQSSSRYWTYVPTSYVDGGAALPVVVAMHGQGDVGRSMCQLWQQTAEANDVIVVAPDDADQSGSWNFGDDVAWVGAVMTEVGTRWNIDEKRRHLWGFSAGAHWTLAIGLANANFFASIGATSGTLTSAQQIGVWPNQVQRQIPVALASGDQDPNLPGVRAARDALNGAGHQVFYEEFNGGHTVTPAVVDNAWTFMEPFQAP